MTGEAPGGAGLLVAPDLAVSRGPLVLDDAVVVGDPDVLMRTGLRFVGARAEIVSSVDQVGGRGFALLVAETVDDTVSFLAAAASLDSCGVLTPVGGSATTHLLESGAGGLTLFEVTVDGELVLFRLRRQHRSDEAGGPAAAVLAAWLEDRATHLQDDGSGEQQAAELLAVLRHLAPTPHVPGPSERDDPVAALRALEREHAGLKREHASLRRKYDALSASKLGRLTLDYWSWKGRRGAGRA